MTRILVDASTLIALGTVGELELLTSFDGQLVVLPAIRDEVTTEPARTNLSQFVERESVEVEDAAGDSNTERARALLGDSRVTGDVRLIATVLGHVDAGRDVGVVSDDRRVRTVARGIGAEVTGTIGAIVRAVAAGRSADEGKRLVRAVDGHGLHMTGELRDRAYELIEEAAHERS